MKNSVTVREYARLTTVPVAQTLVQATVTTSAFDWLCAQNGRLATGGAALVQVEGRQWLRLDNYVGVVETPCGTRIEILPKHIDEGEGALQSSRQLLVRMVTSALDLPTREMGPTFLYAFEGPLNEWVISHFLGALDRLVKRGLRFEYQRLEEERRFLRGRLNLVKQVRQPPGREHYFQIQHDVFEPNRPENRLLRAAVELVCQVTRDSVNWRLGRELANFMAVIPPSRDIEGDFRAWRHDRLMTHYRPVKPWCELILNRQNPLTVLGKWHGISLLFPMEKLFEGYVAGCLRQHLVSGATLQTQVKSQHLCRHQSQLWFQLRPDIMICQGDRRWILDAKWKVLDGTKNNGTEKYGLSQADFYQLYAYGERYLGGVGDLFLIYPKNQTFTAMLPVFNFSDRLRLWVVPFDLDNEQLLNDQVFLPLARNGSYPASLQSAA